MKRSTSANSTISSNLSRISLRFIPRIAPLKKTFSRPVKSGWKPVPTSSSAPARPHTCASPEVGSVTPERIFRSVVFPAPLRPMIPSTSPRGTSKLTPPRAASSPCSGRAVPRARWSAERPPRTIASRRLPWSTSRSPRRYVLLRSRTESARSDDVCKDALQPLEVDEPGHEDDEPAQAGEAHLPELRPHPAEHRPAEPLDGTRHRVEPVERLPRLREVQRLEGDEDRAREQPEPQEKRNEEPDVPVPDGADGQPRTDAGGGPRREEDEGDRRPHALQRRKLAVANHHHEEDERCEREVDERGKDGRERREQAREVHLREQRRVADEAARRERH